MIAVVGHAVHVPGASGDQLLGADAGRTMPPAQDARLVLGRKGLLYKEPATVLALCAVQRALGLPDGPVAAALGAPSRTAVVVSSNLGNVHTVTDMARRAEESSFKEISPLETPNASSNVIAGTIAIRFGATGPNVTLCNGATSGLDAVRLGARLLHADRADLVVVAGVEPGDPIASALAARRAPHAFAGKDPRPLREAAAAVVLARGTTGVLLGEWGRGATPTGADLGLPAHGRRVAAGEVVDLTERLGDTYGAQGVLHTACAAAWLTRRGEGSALVTAGDAAEGHLWTRLSLEGGR